MANINFNFNSFQTARGRGPSPLGGGRGSLAGQAGAAGLLAGVALGGALSSLSPEALSGCPSCGRSNKLCNSLKNAFGADNQPGSYGEVEISQNKKPKKGQKSIPPDVNFKGDLNKLPEILKAAGLKGEAR